MNQRKKMFNKYGFMLFRNALNKGEKKNLLDNIKLIENDVNNNFKYGYDLDIQGKYVITSIRNFTNSNKFLNDFLQKEKIYKIIKEIYNKDVKLLNEEIQYNSKQIIPYNSIIKEKYTNNKHNTIKCFINLDDSYINSCIQLLPTLKNNNINSLDFNWTNCPTIFGDLILVNSYIPYRYTQNNSNITHKTLKITYCDIN
jgi:hypothetical protein